MEQEFRINTKEEFVAHGKLLTLELTMDAYRDNRTRTIRIWLPKDYDGQRRFPVLYMHDGQNLFNGADGTNNWHVDNEMESLEKEGLSAIIVGVDNAPTRMSELCPDMPINPDIYDVCKLPQKEIISTGHLYAKFITEQLKPFIDRNFLTLADQKNTAIGGSSMGGLMSLYMLLKYPEVYSKAMVFSPNFITHQREVLLDWINNSNFSQLENSRIFIFHGGVGLEAANWPFVQDVVAVMQKHGMDDTHLALVYDSRQPHYETAWQKYFSEAFRYLFIADNSEAKYFK